MNKKVCMFPGQGSQFTGMLSNHLYNKYPQYIECADKILGYSIVELCNDKSKTNLLNQTQFTQPAIYVVNALSYFDYAESGNAPDYLVGHSLGEFNALVAAGVMSFETGLALIRERGKLMAEVSTGSMAAIIGIYREKILEILKIYHLDNIDIANCNSYKQTVIAGPISDLQRAKEFFVAAGAKFIFLKVSGPFHSRYMRDAAMKFKPVIDEIYFEQPIIPVISNYLAEEYTRSKVGDNLINQIYNPVKWVETIEFLVKNNVMEFIQIGPGRTLNNLCKNILNHR